MEAAFGTKYRFVIVRTTLAEDLPMMTSTVVATLKDWTPTSAYAGMQGDLKKRILKAIETCKKAIEHEETVNLQITNSATAATWASVPRGAASVMPPETFWVNLRVGDWAGGDDEELWVNGIDQRADHALFFTEQTYYK